MTVDIPAARPESSRNSTQNLAAWRLAGIVDRNFIWVLLLILVAGATLSNSVFLTQANLFNILSAAAPLGLLVLAQGFVLISGNFDLSTEANLIFSAVVAGRLMVQSDLPWWIGLIALLAVASAVGLFNGLLIVKIGMNNFMATLGVSITLTGLTLAVNNAQQMSDLPRKFVWVGSATTMWAIPVAGLFLLGVFVVVHVLLTRTLFGRRLYAVGSNRKAARAAGINDDRVVIVAYVISGFLSGLAAFLVVGRLGVASASISSGQLFYSIAAAVVGGVSLLGGRGTVAGMLGGLLLMGSITNAMNLSSVPPQYISAITGAVILFAVFTDAIRRGRLARRWLGR
jgi:ribose/xylose/arabinose/galactoside ABC-type transport system permease subunit